jgi:hypothetical protein
MRAHYWFSPTLCAAIGLLGACSSSPTGPSEKKQPVLPPGVSLVLLIAPSEATIKNGQNLLLTVSRQDAHGLKIASTEVEWVSSNAKVARISSDGTVIGAGSGTTEITARWHGMRGASKVTVASSEPLPNPCPSLAIAAVGSAARIPQNCGVR